VLTAVGEDIKPLFTVNEMQGERSGVVVDVPYLLFLMSSDVTLREAQDPPAVSGAIMGMTHNTRYLTEMVELANAFCEG